MAYYESIFIVRQDITAAQVEALTVNFADIIRNGGGQVTKTEQWGLRTLAYKIRKNRKGHYVLFNLDAPSAAVLEMERNMRINEDVLRFMTVRVDELEAGPSAIMRREERDERGGRDDRGGRGGFDRSSSGRPPRRYNEETTEASENA
ncbi:MAG: 30S ribosomal protein S6 [Alphaproteobacteria bacterium]|nr:30S ribosomal protein S6 [Alphaproteobacteria bacterium]